MKDMQFTITSNTRIKFAPVTVTKRIFSTNNIDNRFENINWLSVLSFEECQSAFTNFHTLYREIYDECFPLITFHECYKNNG